MNYKKVLWVFGIMLVLQTTSMACSCTGGARLVSNEVKRSTLVMVGKVISVEEIQVEIKDSTLVLEIERLAFFNKVTFHVLSLFKGKHQQQKVVVYTGLGSGDCGFPFVVGRKYVLYGNKSASPFLRDKKVSPKKLDQAYWTDICTRTKAFSPTEVSELRKLRREKKIYRSSNLLKKKS